MKGSKPDKRILTSTSIFSRGALLATTSLIACICSGVLPQHPPTIFTRPLSAHSSICSAMSFASLFKQLLNEGGGGLDLAKMHSNTPPAKQLVDYREGYTALLGMNDADVENLLTVRSIDSDQLQHWLTITTPCVNRDLSFSASARMQLLKVLYHLKTAPILRELARFVPTGLQRRIKQRLSR